MAQLFQGGHFLHKQTPKLARWEARGKDFLGGDTGVVRIFYIFFGTIRHD